MTTNFASGFSFDFNAVSVNDNPIDEFPFDAPLAAVISDVRYKNLAKKDSGEEKIRLVITQKVYHDNKEGSFDTIISPNQAYILKQYLVAVGVDANDLSGQPLDEDGLRGLLMDRSVTLTMQEREWDGKKYRNFKKVSEYGGEAVSDDIPF